MDIDSTNMQPEHWVMMAEAVYENYSRYDGFYEDTALISTFLDDFVSKRGVMYYNTEDDPECRKPEQDSFDPSGQTFLTHI